MRNRLLVAAGLTATLAAAASLLMSREPGTHAALVPIVFRWSTVLVAGAYATSRRSLTAWIFVALAAGVELGHDWPSAGTNMQFLGTIFLRLIKVIIAPLLFSTLVVGIAGHADLKRIGRLGIKSLVYFEIVSTIALLLGFVAINLSHAGENARLQAATAGVPLRATPQSATQLITDIFPENVAKSVAEGQVLQIVIFSVLFGMALALVPEGERRSMLTFASSLSETMFKVTNLVMLAAPAGVFGAVAYTVGHMGLGVLVPLLKLLATMYVALAVFIVCVLLPLALFVRVPIKEFLQAAMEPVAIAFATASAEAALPRAMERMETLGVRRDTVAFILPIGYSFNLDGSSLYQSVALVFIAQAAGIHLTVSQQAAMFLTLMISSKGTAGVARASLIVVLGAASSFQLPTEPLFLLFGIDQLLDMGRTAVNVLGNCLACVVLARWEGEF